MTGFNNPIVQGDGELVRSTIHSPNYQTGVSGWTINKDGSAEFANGIFRGAVNVGTPPAPNIQITTTIPASLVAATAGIYTIVAGTFYFYNATDFYFDFIGTALAGPFQVLVRGQMVGGAFVQFEEYAGTGAANTGFVSYGRNGSTPLAWSYENGSMQMSPSASITQNGYTGSLIGTKDIRSTQPIMCGVSTAGAASSAGVETPITIANWANYPTGDFENGHVFFVTLECMVNSNVAGLAQAGNIRLRQGTSPSIAGNLLREWVTDPVNSFTSQRFLTGYFRNNTGSNRNFHDLTLSYVRGAGANTVSLRGTVGSPLILNVYDLGLINRAALGAAAVSDMV